MLGNLKAISIRENTIEITDKSLKRNKYTLDYDNSINKLILVSKANPTVKAIVAILNIALKQKRKIADISVTLTRLLPERIEMETSNGIVYIETGSYSFLKTDELPSVEGILPNGVYIKGNQYVTPKNSYTIYGYKETATSDADILINILALQMFLSDKTNREFSLGNTLLEFSAKHILDSIDNKRKYFRELAKDIVYTEIENTTNYYITMQEGDNFINKLGEILK